MSTFFERQFSDRYLTFLRILIGKKELNPSYKLEIIFENIEYSIINMTIPFIRFLVNQSKISFALHFKSSESQMHLVFSTYFLLLKRFITKENIDENFLDEQMVDIYQDFSIYQN
jgi:hypothetical protein